MSETDRAFLERMARKYVWWKTPVEALAYPDRVIAQVMDIGAWADVQALAKRTGEPRLAQVLSEAEIGQFTPRSWAYWHYRLGLDPSRPPPPMPQRHLG